MDDLYCKIFVSTEMSGSALAEHIAIRLGGKAEDDVVTAGTFKLEVWDSDDFDLRKSQDPEDGFLYYRYYMDVEPAANASEPDYIRDVGNILTALRKIGCKAVAACDFEERLPGQ